MGAFFGPGSLTAVVQFSSVQAVEGSEAAAPRLLLAVERVESSSPEPKRAVVVARLTR